MQSVSWGLLFLPVCFYCLSQVCLLQLLWSSTQTGPRSLHTSLSHWAVGFRATLLDGDWGGSQAEEGNQSVPLTGDQKQDPPALSDQQQHQTVEFTGVSLSLESRVILSTSQCTVSVIRHHLIMSEHLKYCLYLVSDCFCYLLMTNLSDLYFLVVVR